MSFRLKDPVSSLTHFSAALLSLIGLILLVYLAAIKATAWHIVSFSIYGASLVLLYTSSTLYHSLNLSIRTNEILRQLDHAMIYILIAGTYTPVCLVVLRGGWGWSLFGINWTLAIAGVILKMVFPNPRRWLLVVLFVFYIVMGWLIVIAFIPLVHILPSGGVFWLILGGIFYTAGTIFLNQKIKDLIPGVFGAHDVWHLFVMAGSFCHFWLMLRYILYMG